MKSNKKLTPLEKEKLLDQEEIIEFYYHDKESKTKILIKDKRKIKVALMEMEEYERKQRSDIMEFECPYNAKTDDPVSEDDYDEIEYEQTEFEKNLEDVLQEMVDKIANDKENSQKIKKIILESLDDLTQKQLITIFLYYYMELSETQIADYLGVSRQRIYSQIDRISKKLFKKSK